MPAAREVVEQLAGPDEVLEDLGAGEVVHHRGKLLEVAEQQEVDLAVHGEAGDVTPKPVSSIVISSKPGGSCRCRGAGQQQALALEAVEHRILRQLPVARAADRFRP